MKNEIIKMDDETYFSHSALSNSFLINFDRAPAFAFIEKEETKAMELGTMYHCAILEPEIFEKEYAVFYGKPDRRLKEYKDFADLNSAKEIVLQTEIEAVQGIKKNLMSAFIGRNEKEDVVGIQFSDFFNLAQKEMAIFWTENIFNVEVSRRAKLDLCLETEKYNVIVDAKATTDCMKFDKKIIDFQLYRQAETYSRGLTAINGKKSFFYYLVFETKAPYGVKCFEIDDEYLALGEKKNLLSINNYLEWQKAGADKNIIYDKNTSKIFKPTWLN